MQLASNILETASVVSINTTKSSQMISYVKTELVSKILDPLSGIDLMSDLTAHCICRYSGLRPSVESVLHDSQSHETVKCGGTQNQ